MDLPLLVLESINISRSSERIQERHCLGRRSYYGEGAAAMSLDRFLAGRYRHASTKGRSLMATAILFIGWNRPHVGMEEKAVEFLRKKELYVKI